MIVLSYMSFCVLYWVTIVLFLAANGLGIGLIRMCMYIFIYIYIHVNVIYYNSVT